jgi:succinyl-CoA synthetase beta subunit
MNLHEYQGKQLFAQYGLPVSQGIAVDTPEAAAEAAKKLAATSGLLKHRYTLVAAVKRAV